jgi:hypothetical protein
MSRRRRRRGRSSPTDLQDRATRDREPQSGSRELVRAACPTMSQDVPLSRTTADGTALALLPQAFPSDFPAPQQTAVLALLAGATLSAAAEAAGVDRRTIYRWKNENAEFVAVLNQLRHELAVASIQALLALAPVAVETIRQLLLDRRTPPPVRLKAALEIVNLVREQKAGPTDEAGAKAALNRGMLQRALGI